MSETTDTTTVAITPEPAKAEPPKTGTAFEGGKFIVYADGQRHELCGLDQLEEADHLEIRKRYLASRGNPLEALAPEFARIKRELPPEEAKQLSEGLMDRLYRDLTLTPAKVPEAEVSAWVRSGTGWLFVAYLMMRKADPLITEEKANQVMATLGKSMMAGQREDAAKKLAALAANAK